MAKAKLILDVTPDDWRKTVSVNGGVGAVIDALIEEVHFFEVRASRESLIVVVKVPFALDEPIDARAMANRICEKANDAVRAWWAKQ